MSTPYICSKRFYAHAQIMVFSEQAPYALTLGHMNHAHRTAISENAHRTS